MADGSRSSAAAARSETAHGQPATSRVNNLSQLRTVVRATGSALPDRVVATSSSRFGYDFSEVRVHDDEQAAASARQFHADAYTVGSHIVFAAGAFAPDTQDGRRLLEHELVHVMQQRTASLSGFAVSDPSSDLEAEADRLSTNVDTESQTHVRRLASHQHIARQATRHPDPDCEDLLVQIIARALELYLRADALIRDPLELPRTGPMSIEGHQQQFRNKQVNLRSMLNQWDTNNCGDGYLPRRVWHWATRDVPSPNAQLPVRRVPIASSGERIPVRVGGGDQGAEWSREVNPPRSASSLSPAEAVLATGATIGAGYLLYRGIRFLPSLLPPLWWTIPANAAVP